MGHHSRQDGLNTMKTESTVQTEIIKYVRREGGYVIKVIRGNDDGIHDLIICLDGRFISCEVKREEFAPNPNKAMSPRQVKHMGMVKAARGLSVCVASLEQFIDFLHDEFEYHLGLS